MKSTLLRLVGRSLSRLPLFCLLIPLLLLAGGRVAFAQKTPITRALLIACDEFVIQDSLAPSAGNSATDMMVTLSRSDDLQIIRTEIDTLSSVYQLQRAIEETFGDATEDDVSFLYIATHGNFRADSPGSPATLTLSNGQVDTTFGGEKLRAMLDKIPGTKIVFIDACNSGALIQKGISLSTQNSFSLDGGEDYKILTSASGNELSWHYSKTGEEGARPGVGSSYFASALSAGLGKDGGYLADLNRDGSITMDELYRYLLANNATSTVQMYPQRDDFVLMTYDPADVQTTRHPAVEDVNFDNESLSFDQSALSFSFTVREPVRLQYQITNFRDDHWDWENASRILDTFETVGAEGDDALLISPGRKQRVLQMPDITSDTSGHVLFQIMAIQEDRLTLVCSRLISVLPTQGDPELSITLPVTTFAAFSGTELPIYVHHGFPLRLSLTLYDLEGDDLVCRIVDHQLTRPLSLSPQGSVYYWDGKDQYGNKVPSGVYTLVATTRVGEETYTTQPLLFQVIASEE